MKKTTKHGFSLRYKIGAVLLLVAALIAVLVSLLVNTNSETVKDGRSSFYVVSGGVGGACSYYISDSMGNHTDECVDRASLENATTGVSQINVLTDSNTALLVDANVRVVEEKRSPATAKPVYSVKKVVHLTKVYSAKKISLSKQ